MSGTLSAQLYSVRAALGQDRPAALARLAGLGYRYAEPFALGFWNTPTGQIVANARALRADLDAAGLAASSTHVAIPAGGQDAVVQVCQFLGTDTAIVAIPLLVEGFDGPVFASRDNIAAFAGRLNEVAEELSGHDIRLGYHNHQFEWTELPDGSLGFDVLWEYLDPSVGAELDVYWATAAGQDPAAILERLGERVLAVHLEDGPGGPDDAMQPKPQTPLGSGAVHVPAVLRAADSVRWHITEVDICETDPFELLGTNGRILVDSGHSAF